MTNTEKEVVIRKGLDSQDLFTLLSVENTNHKPHPFCVGPEHIERYRLNTSKRCAMRVGPNGEWSTRSKKGFVKCGLSYEEHTYDCVGFLQLKRNGTNDEAKTILKALVDEIGETFVDGFGFVETKKKFRIS
jgi:hypothetical protein